MRRKGFTFLNTYIFAIHNQAPLAPLLHYWGTWRNGYVALTLRRTTFQIGWFRRLTRRT